MSSDQQDRLLQRQARTSKRRETARAALAKLCERQSLVDLHRAPTVVHLPCCKNGCGEMLALDDGWQCPICNWYRGYYRGERHP